MNIKSLVDKIQKTYADNPNINKDDLLEKLV